jgi:hypothetical protein
LNPLLLRSATGIAHNAWYRGSQEGIGVVELNSLLPLRAKLSWKVLTHVVLQAKLQSAGTRREARAPIAPRPLPKTAFMGMLTSLRDWIADLHPRDTGPSVWSAYSTQHSYSDAEAAAKRDFVGAFTAAAKPGILWDLGCNTGNYSKVALNSGAQLAVGFDADHGALEFAYDRARAEDLNFLPLYLDATNPPPSQGWAECERRGLSARAPADGILALALIHHLAIARNIPLEQVVNWLLGLAPQGVIEFVPKNDPMVQRLLQLREDIFPNYSADEFLRLLSSRAQIVSRETISKTGRQLIWYSRDARSSPPTGPRIPDAPESLER